MVKSESEKMPLAPGRVLLKNVSVGPDPSDSRFQILRDEDSGLEFRCRRNFSDTNAGISFNGGGSPFDLFFGLSESHPGLFFPVAMSFDKDYAFLLEPDSVKRIFPGGVAVLDYKDSFGAAMCLRKSPVFYDDTLARDEDGNYFPRNKYELMVHHPKTLSGLELQRPSLDLIYKIERHIINGRSQNHNHIDAENLGFYCEEMHKDNVSRLNALRNGEFSGKIWWEYVSELPSSLFEDLVVKVHKQKSGFRRKIEGTEEHRVNQGIEARRRLMRRA